MRQILEVNKNEIGWRENKVILISNKIINVENEQKFVTLLSILHSFQQSLSLKHLHNYRKNISRILSVLNIFI